MFCISETWLLENPTTIPDQLKDFKFVFSPALKDKSRGRASGGLILFYKEHLDVVVLQLSPWWIVVKLTATNFKLIITAVYFKPNLDTDYLLQLLQLVLDDVDRDYGDYFHIIGGDFNCRVGNMGHTCEEVLSNTSLSLERNSYDSVVKPSGRSLIDFMAINSFTLLNGRTISDFPGRYTFVSALGNSTIDLVFVRNNGLHVIYDQEVLFDLTGSPHFPVKTRFEYHTLNKEGVNLKNRGHYRRECIKWRQECGQLYQSSIFILPGSHAISVMWIKLIITSLWLHMRLPNALVLL